ncbi:MAG: beta-galactosidase [Chthoniobacterales bacterium]
MKHICKNSLLKLLALFVCFYASGGGVMSASTWKIGAAKAGEGSIQKILPGQPIIPNWTIEKVADSIEGEILSGHADGETHPIPVIIPKAGTYRVWVRHYHTDGGYTSFNVVFRDELGQVVDFHNVDFRPQAQVGTAKPELLPVGKPAPPVAAATPAVGTPKFVWTSFDITFEHPTEGTLSFGNALGVVNSKLGIDCIVITDDKAFDPAKTDVAKLGADGGPVQPQAAPAGMQPAPVLTAHSSFFAGELDQEKRFEFSFINQQSTYRDYAWAVQMGGNYDHGWPNGSTKYGIDTEISADYGYLVAQKFGQTVASPTGRFVNADGKVIASNFSLSYEPYMKASMEEMNAHLGSFIQDPDAKNIMVSDEGSGYFDYGDAAKEAYHKFLAQRFGTIGNLNTLWKPPTPYKSFEEIILPQSPAETDNKANWFAFREFSGLEFVKGIAGRAKVAREFNGRKLHATSQSSCLGINSPHFTANGPMDFEDVINIGFAGENHFGVDAYSTADSFAGCDIDFLLSLTKGKKFVNNEFNVHSQDPRNMSQTYWAMLSKGTKGAATWCFQATPNLWMYYMWSLLNENDTPRDKLGVIADANQEVHHLERILGSAKSTPFVKPVALYYSRMDLSLKQTSLGIYSGSIDSPYRIYSVLRGLGYTVRWITPKQIEAGELKDVSAVFMLGANHVPGAAAAKLAEWVKAGGCLAGDQWPGGFDEYDRTQTTLMDVFGIRPAVTAQAMNKTAAKDALAITTTPVAGGVEPEVLRSLSADELFKNVEEMWDQFDSKHPVAKATGNWHLSGFELKKAQIISSSAEVVAMTMGNEKYPGIVINDYGKGHALYSAIMMGTLYEAGPVAFEWDSSREGPAVPHLINAFLKFSGVKAFSEVGLPERMGWKMRVEAPLVDPNGNVFVGLTSLNDSKLPAFPLTLNWLPNLTPKMVLTATAGSRELKQVPFEVKSGKLCVTMPGFDTAASLLALKDSGPLVSLDITGAPRGVANLLDVTPKTRLKIKVTVWNPSPNKLPAGEVKLFTVPGWFCNAGEMKVGEIEPYGHQEVIFEVAPPEFFTKYTLRPIVFKYAAGKVTSTPCTEMVWWKNAPTETTKVGLTE